MVQRLIVQVWLNGYRWLRGGHERRVHDRRGGRQRKRQKIVCLTYLH